MKSVPWVILLGVLVNPHAFGQAPADTATQREDLAFFEQKVRPLLIERCFECHSQSAKKQKGGLLLDSREAILRGGDTGPAAIVGEPKKSLLIEAVTYKNTDLQMPPKSKLSAREVEILEQWVKRGMIFPSSSSAPQKRTIDIAAGKKFWSFQPLATPEPPAVSQSSWPQGRIDRFVLAELEQRKLTPAKPADRLTLLRRAKFDIVGLPPTPEEIESFLRDTRPNAFAERVDQWLASPHYGERWGRYWLDLVRYCDIAEDWTETKGKPYHYRDWVIKALNDDVPYTRFLRLQLAADQMSDARPEDRAALGLIGLSPTYWKELQLPVEIIKTIVSDEYEERIHTLSSTFLGLNMACARCHDHKNDPITTEDYYALAGVFASTRQADQALMAGVDGLAIAQTREKVDKLEAEIKKLSAKKGDDQSKKIEEIRKQIAQLKQLPGYDATLVPGAVDASLGVIAAKGSHGSQVIYKPGPQDLAVEVRGNPNKPGAIVPRRFVSVLSRGEPARFTKGSGRLELANAMIEESTPLLARVFVNRIWKLHFGIGLVETPSDFGAQGERPSHPALLEDLARRFVENGWSMKWLHREVMLSATYAQASGPAPAGDVGLRYYSRFPRRLLDIEAWRDSLLFVTGDLDLQVGGAPIELAVLTNRRRTVYGTVHRRALTDLLRLHDFPDPVTHSPSRLPTITPLQQLFTLNSPLMAQQANRLASRLKSDAGTDNAARVTRAYRLLYGRSPTESQLRLGQEFVKSNTDAAWRAYCHVLLASNEFSFVD